MKRITIAIVAAAALAAAAGAAEVGPDEAKLAVAGWENIKAALDGEITAAPESVKEYPAKDGKGKFYVVSLAGGGFVVVSGDTQLVPVLAYSKDGEWVDNVSRNPLLAMLPIDVAAAMDGMSGTGILPVARTGNGLEARSTQRAGAGAAGGGNAAKWAKLLAAAGQKSERAGAGAGRLSSVNDLRVGVLLTTSWNQSGNGENLYTPNNRVCGCVATAAAQVLFHHKWPRNTEALIPYQIFSGNVDGGDGWILNTDGSGGWRTSADAEYTAWNPAFGGPYDWEAMANGETTAKKQAIGRLTRDVGLMSKMNYASGGSGAHESEIFLSLKRQLGYANANYIRVNSSWQDGRHNWRNAFISNFDAHLPVLVEVPGHAIVADGYGYQDGTLYMHFNLGWGGSSNAWYAPPDLTQALSGFNSIVTFIYNIIPNGPSGRTIVSGRLLASSGASIGDGSTVVAKNQSSGETYSVVTTNGIYALHLPSGNYTIGAENGSGMAAATNLTVAACVDTTVFTGGGYVPNTGTVGNMPGVELKYASVGAPVIASAADNGAFYGASLPVELSSGVVGAEIRYTLDGTEPTASSTLYEGVLSITGGVTLKARAFLNGFAGGATAVATFTHSAYWGGKYADTRANRAAHWIEETASTHNATGAWAGGEGFGTDGLMPLNGAYGKFSASTRAKGRMVTVSAKATADEIGPHIPGGPEEAARAAVEICGEDGDNFFNVMTRSGGALTWVRATGKTPVAGTEYEIRLALDTAAKTYTAWVVEDGASTQLLGAAGSGFETGVFPFANEAAGGVADISVAGDATLEHIDGSYVSRKGFFLRVK